MNLALTLAWFGATLSAAWLVAEFAKAGGW